MPLSPEAHHAQIMRGVLDMCVLACLVDEPSYGYELLKRLEDAGLPAGSEASIYLLLKRLKKNELAKAELVDSDSGPARKVYHATDLGKEVLAEWIEDYQQVSRGVEKVLSHLK